MNYFRNKGKFGTKVFALHLTPRNGSARVTLVFESLRRKTLWRKLQVAGFESLLGQRCCIVADVRTVTVSWF